MIHAGVVVEPENFETLRSFLALAAAQLGQEAVMRELVPAPWWRSPAWMLLAAATVTGIHVYLPVSAGVLHRIPPEYWAPSLFVLTLALSAHAMMRRVVRRWRASAPRATGAS